MYNTACIILGWLVISISAATILYGIILEGMKNKRD